MSELKTVFAPHLNRTVKFGRRAPRIPQRRLMASKVIDLSMLPAVPDTTDFRAHADKSLRNVYGNDQLGDCVPAWLAHFLGLVTGAAGNSYIATLDQVVKMYEAIGGYVPGKPETDQGCDEDTAISYVEQHGWPNGTKALGAISVDATNAAEVHAANWLFGGLMFGVGLPDAWVDPFPEKDGAVWDVAGPMVPDNGHCFGSVDNDPRGLIIDSWGLYLLITFGAIAKYAVPSVGGQLFAILTPDQLAKGMAKAPNGVDWSTIVSQFDARGGTVPVPAPEPTPPPAPLPPPPAPAPHPSSGPTIEQAVHWATTPLATGPRLMTRSDAVALASHGLITHWPKAGS